MGAWYALLRGADAEEPEAVDPERRELWSKALREEGYYHLLSEEVVDLAAYNLGEPCQLTRKAAIARLRRKGWRVGRLPGRFWEAAGGQ